MVAVNLVVIAGNLTRDPVVKFIAQDRAVCNFGVAVNNRFKTADGQQKEETTFVEVEAWGRTAEACGQYLTKGRPVLVEGRLTQSTYEKDGQKVTKTRVRADSVQFLGGPQDRAERNAQLAEQPPARQPAAASAGADEPPF